MPRLRRFSRVMPANAGIQPETPETWPACAGLLSRLDSRWRGNDDSHFLRYPGPRSARPGRSAVIVPFATTARPLTRTVSIPTE